MPKRVGFLYQKMCDKDMIRLAIINSSKNKRHRYDVQRVIGKIDRFVDKTYELLVSENFVPTAPKIKSRYDNTSRKMRNISVVPYWPDGVIHQLMVLVLKDTITKGMYAWTCAAIPERGASRADKYVQRCLKKDAKGTKYILKMDVRKFYPSIDHEHMIRLLERKVKDRRFLKLVRDILSTSESGLPIGYFICQWLANFYLETLDRFICSIDGVEHYVRYMDDLVVFGRNKKKLHKARNLISDFLDKELKLSMKNNWQVFPLKSRPLDFVGVKQYRTHRTIRKRTFLRFTRQCRRAMKRLDKGWKIPPKMASAIVSRAGLLKRVNSLKARQKYYYPIGEKMLKKVISNESKRKHHAGYSIYLRANSQKAG